MLAYFLICWLMILVCKTYFITLVTLAKHFEWVKFGELNFFSVHQMSALYHLKAQEMAYMKILEKLHIDVFV